MQVCNIEVFQALAKKMSASYELNFTPRMACCGRTVAIKVEMN
jgi:hypothetical protein